MSGELYVINLRGEREPFSWQKVYKSAKRAGAPSFLSKDIADKIEEEAYQDIKTSEIFRQIRKFLREKSPRAGLRFDLKKAMRMLGPTGFAFEKYAAEIFSEKGFKTKLNKIVAGRCCKHEIDFIAENNEKIIYCECKYRNQGGSRIDLPLILQNSARFSDIRNSSSLKERSGAKKLETLVITNTKFTSEAIRYSSCAGTGLLGWRYPRKQGLEYFIETHKLYPITILPSFKKSLFAVFSEKKIMLAKDVLSLDVDRFTKENNLLSRELQPLIKEAKILLE